MFDIVNLATFAWSVYNVWIGYTGFRYSVWITFFNHKILFNMTLDELVILLLVATCNIMFDGERFKYFFRKSFMSSIVAPQKILTLTEFGFAPDSLFSSISWSMESPANNVVPFAQWVEVVSEVWLLLCGNLLFDLKLL